MTEILLESIIKAINTELKNGLIYVVINNNYNHYNCYEPIDVEIKQVFMMMRHLVTVVRYQVSMNINLTH